MWTASVGVNVGFGHGLVGASTFQKSSWVPFHVLAD